MRGRTSLRSAASSTSCSPDIALSKGRHHRASWLPSSRRSLVLSRSLCRSRRRHSSGSFRAAWLRIPRIGGTPRATLPPNCSGSRRVDPGWACRRWSVDAAGCGKAWRGARAHWLRWRRWRLRLRGRGARRNPDKSSAFRCCCLQKCRTQVRRSCPLTAGTSPLLVMPMGNVWCGSARSTRSTRDRCPEPRERSGRSGRPTAASWGSWPAAN